MRGHETPGSRQPWPASTPQEQLTSREKEVMDCVASGLSEGGIAKQLGLSRNTVKFHLKNIYAKFGVTRRASAIEKHIGQALGEGQ